MAQLIFDYDGTIHNSMMTYAPAFRDTMKWLSDNGYIEPKEYADSEISCWLGFNSTDMWGQFHPELDKEIREKARKMLGENMADRVERGEGRLFPHTEETLAKLKEQGHTLIFLSNCRVHYMERHRRVFGLDRFFDRFYCCEEYGFIPKYEIFRRFSSEGEGQYIVIGDRFHDIETAVKNSLSSVGCAYGYGSLEELSDADIIVKDITEIPEAVRKLAVS
ncbi:HAD family hydrolase [Ruminococcus sp. XPD3002]|uniref:HAD family hydrolase n=1 Tax=Ruminococcus sp. XPD3002 TaxID=1452269 RepID=UPI00091AB538|nr:phosphoglycolate phosphatase [Ruminococcus flavefaciens]HRU97781.1 HAD family hydrolase [Ruminococcus sp.]